MNEGYDTTEMPGLKENSIGYHTDSGKVFPYFHDFRYFDDSTGRETVGKNFLSAYPNFGYLHENY